MALKVLMLRKRLTEARGALSELLAKKEELKLREDEIAKAIEEASTDEEKKAVEDEIKAFDAEKEELEAKEKELGDQINELEKDLAKQEEEQEQPAAPAPADPEARNASVVIQERKVNTVMNRRTIFDRYDEQTRNAIFADDSVKNWISNIRSLIGQKRSIEGIGVTIPEKFLGVLRENLVNYSKLYRHVNVIPVNGTGREVVMGTIPEAVWLECCKALNELDLAMYDAETDCYMVGGYFKICNRNLKDSDLDLAAEILTALAQAIAMALDKAILYGKNTNDNNRMPLGIISRLAQTSKPADYPLSARPWVDMHTTHMLTVAGTGLTFFQNLLINVSVCKGKYSRGEKVWAMNETTYNWIKAQALSINANGALVTGVGDTLPVIGGIVEILDFMPNYVVAGGYLDLYLLAERGGEEFASSEAVFWLNNATAFKGIANYDGLPVIAEGFLVFGVNSTTPNSTMDFAADTANTVQFIGLNFSSVTLAATETAKLVATMIPKVAGESVTFATSDDTYATVDEKGVITAVATGSAVITASCGNAVAVCNVTVS